MAIATINPTTGTTEREFEPHSAEEVESRIAAAHSATKAMRSTTFAERAEWMRKAADLLEGDVDSLAELITIEMGKPLAQSRGEVLKCAKGMRYYADNSEQFLADEPLDDPSTVNASSAWTGTSHSGSCSP